MEKAKLVQKPKRSRKFWRIVIPIASVAVVAAGTLLAIKIGQGYRPTTEGLKGTGLLAANSFPNGAQVYLDGKLTTATDDTINLPPGDYQVRIEKDGFIPWEKTVTVQKELVAQTNATLFPSVPSLSPLSLTGATNITPSPDGQKLAYAVASASATAKNGLYVLELNNSTLSFQKSPKQIAKNTPNLDFADANLLWSPDSSQILTHFGSENQNNYLLDTGILNSLDEIPDVTPRLPIIFAQWEEEITNRETKQFALLPGAMQQIATQSAKNIYFSPNEEKVMYTATQSALLPENLIDTPPATSTQPEVRELEPNKVYVYDLKEDKNFYIADSIDDAESESDLATQHLLLLPNYQQFTSAAATNLINQEENLLADYSTLRQINSDTPTADTIKNFITHYSSMYVNQLQWFPNSSHILIKRDEGIEIVEYDGTNRTSLYSGPLADEFLYPWPDGSKLIVLANLNPSSIFPPNLYTIDLR